MLLIFQTPTLDIVRPGPGGPRPPPAPVLAQAQPRQPGSVAEPLIPSRLC